MDLDEGPHVIGDDGEFHAVDDEVDLSATPIEAWAALALFWALGATVLYQFVTRYALNNSAAWTEEIARYLLIGTVFVGAAIGVAKNNHVQVDLMFRYLPRSAARGLATVIDALRIGFFGAMTALTARLMQKMGNYQMTIVDLPMNIVYGVCLLGFAACTVRAVGLARLHLQRGYSVLERPDGAANER